MKIQSIDKGTCKAMRDPLTLALRTFAAEHGLDVQVGTMKYSGTEIRMQVTLTTRAADGTPIDLDREYLRVHGQVLGLPANAFGVEFSDGVGQTYRIVGLAPRSRKYPVVCQRLSDGKRLRFQTFTVRAYLGSVRSLPAVQS
jgi:hypothetical protein